MESLGQIAEWVCKATGYDLAGLRLKRRDVFRVAARQLFCYYAHKEKHSLWAIGAFVDIDHATVAHSVKVIREKKEIDFIVKNYVRAYEIMSKKKQIIEIEPPSSSDQAEERTELSGFYCPICNGRGWRLEYGIRETDKVLCDRCGGSGRLKVRVVLLWEKDGNG